MELTRYSKNLYGINAHIKDITQNPIVDHETGEIISDRYDELSELEATKDEIVRHVALSYKDLNGEIDKWDKEYKRLGAELDRLKRLKERALRYVSENVDKENVKTLEYEFKWTKSESVYVDDINVDFEELKRINPDLVRIKEEVNKVKVKELYKQMNILPKGIEIKPKQSLTIR
ncbi:MAG: hypothetical protein UR73_C0037G0007 [candidate division WS6 bacterium GW2011_GWF1_35_23]|uniref:Uncharacterized protein n=1 Tax=candidate division WS6 bacterium GW2011_GWF1_35_23 TaxID=1619097 RepID=A0A0G0BZS1_9BACT|nr:MAG: hypothetical protein UR73_C0037G0007 [candidate division WS6 bacterium GW2011_GWF1_35_23]